jgi:Glycosyltransferase family 87
VAIAATLAVAGGTLGYDFLAYHNAASRFLAGQPPYDTSYLVAGPFGLFFYPPTFLLVAIPFGLLSAVPATWLWIGLLLAAFGAGVAVMPVGARTRWLIVLLAGLSWPFLYNVKLGQVGPLLFLVFAVGWRNLDRPAILGLTGAIGAAIKIQPGLVLAWALLTRRWAAAVAGVVALVLMAAAATLLVGIPAWSDFLVIIARVNDPITTPHNFTLGAVVYQLGIPRDVAAAIQWAASGLVVLAVVFAALRRSAAASYLVVVVATQMLSPILWDHYAMLLLLPVAWLLDRRRAWTALIPLATCVALVGVVPALVYPAVFGITLVALLAERDPAEAVPPALSPEALPSAP